MKRAVSLAAAVAVMLAALATGAAVAADHAKPSKLGTGRPVGLNRPLAPHVPGEVVVRYKRGVRTAQKSNLAARVGASARRNIPGVTASVLEATPGVGVAELVRRLESDPGVAVAEPNYLRFVDAAVNDTLFSGLWGMHNTAQSHGYTPVSGSDVVSGYGIADADVDAVEAWGTQKGKTGTVIAVIDSGVDPAHPDLNGSLWINPGESGAKATDNVDNDGNGYVDDKHGYDVAENRKQLIGSSAYYGYDHGTHVAGTIAAEDNNSEGVVGVCPNCKIMVLKAMEPYDTNNDGGDDTYALPLDAELAAYAYAKKKGADIINGSFGSTAFSVLSREAIATLPGKGILPVFAAGNFSADNDLPIASGTTPISPAYPASHNLRGILSVAASNDKDQLGYVSACEAHPYKTKNNCSFTSWGNQSVDVTAPGVDILSTLPKGGYGVYDGTSMAAPMVAGIAGLVKSQHPTWTPMQVKNAIMNTTEKPASLGRAYSKYLFTGEPGWPGKFVRTGRVNAKKALTGSTANATPLTDGDFGGAKPITGVMAGTAGWPNDTNDVFKQTLTAGKTYRVTLDGPDGSSAVNLDLLVYKPSALEIIDWDRAIAGGFGSTNDEVAEFTAPSSGSYKFHVYAWLNPVYEYTLEVEEI